MAVDDLAGLRVLVAEDLLLQAMEMEQALQAQGCIVVGPVPKEAAALALLREQRVDMAVVNYRLADADASELIADLQSRRIPFVVVSADPSVEVEFPYLSKPVSGEHLIAALARALREMR